MNNEIPAPEQLVKQVCPDGHIDCRAHPASSLREVVYRRVDPPAAPTAKRDQSGLKEACQRALKLGRTHQETDIQLFLDALLEIERLEAALATVRAEGNQNAATLMRSACIEKVKEVLKPYELEFRRKTNSATNIVDYVAMALESVIIQERKS